MVAQGLCMERVEEADTEGVVDEVCEEHVAEDERLSTEEDIVNSSDLPSLKSDYLVMKYDNLKSGLDRISNHELRISLRK